MTALDERRTGRKPKSKISWYLAGPVVSIVCLPVLMYLCALLLAREVLPYGLMEELVIACVFVSGAAGGAAACAARGGKVMQTGLAVGCILAAAIVVVTLMVPGEGPLNARCLRHVIAAAAGGAFGGAISIKRGNRPKKRRRSR